VRQSGGGQK